MSSRNNIEDKMKLIEFRIHLHELRHLNIEGSLEIYIAEKIKEMKIQDYTPVIQLYDNTNNVYIVKQYQYSLKEAFMLLYGVIKEHCSRRRKNDK